MESADLEGSHFCGSFQVSRRFVNQVWDFESIDQAEAPDEGAVFEIEPMNELLVKEENGHGAMLKWMIKALGEDSLWYAQDANGGIWKLDLSFSHTVCSLIAKTFQHFSVCDIIHINFQVI